MIRSLVIAVPSFFEKVVEVVGGIEDDADTAVDKFRCEDTCFVDIGDVDTRDFDEFLPIEDENEKDFQEINPSCFFWSIEGQASSSQKGAEKQEAGHDDLHVVVEVMDVVEDVGRQNQKEDHG